MTSLSNSSAAADWVRALQRTSHITPQSDRTLFQAILERAEQYGSEDAFVGGSSKLTYADLAARAASYAAWAKRKGLSKGDRVALLLENQPDYAAIWIGLSSVGVVVALINTQLGGDGLTHCLAVAEPRLAIVGAAHLERFFEIKYQGEVWAHGSEDGAVQSIETALDDGSPDRSGTTHVSLEDLALLIFTSGTTGLPKAALVTHFRIMMWSEWFAGITNAKPTDRLYDCLPMYHSVGGVVAVGAMLVAGGAVIIRKKFSAQGFWPDVTASRATIFQYIGELCRYLTAAPPSQAEGVHGLRLCVGNGLSADIWEQFAERFAIPRIIEFYAATEGSFSLFNLEGKVGSIGRVPRYMAHSSPIALVKFDHETESPARGDDGFCLRCGPDECGEAIGSIASNSKSLATRFEGYTGCSATQSKILRNVFSLDDSWFRTGDLMRQDSQGFYYFVDRIGDTFRWKGENVATTDVATALRSFTGIVEAIVFGVTVPFSDGRAGMAAIVTNSLFKLTELRDHLRAKLPLFACPVFLRITSELRVTSTFKPQKQDLVREGFDPTRTNEDLYLDDPGSGRYIKIDPSIYDAICRGAFRL